MNFQSDKLPFYKEIQDKDCIQAPFTRITEFTKISRNEQPHVEFACDKLVSDAILFCI